MTPVIKNKLAVTGIFCTLAAFALSVNGVFPLITSLSQHAGFSFSSFGTIFFVQFTAFSFMSFLLPKLMKRLKLGLRSFVFLGLGGLFGVLIITPYIKTYVLLHVWGFFLGLFGSAIETGSSLLVTRYDKEGSSRMINLSGAVYCIGAIAAPQIIAFLLTIGIHWKMIFLILSGFILGITGLYLVTNISRDERSETAENGISGSRQSAAYKTVDKPTLVFLFISMFLYTGAECGFACWIPAFFEKFHRVSEASASLRLSFYWCGVILGRLAVFFFLKQLNTRLILIIFSWGMAFSGLFFALGRSFMINSLCIFLLGLFAGPVWPCIISAVKENSGAENATSSAIGVGGIGVAVAPLVSGWIIQYKGFSVLFFVLFILVLLMAVSIGIAFIVNTALRRRMPESGG